MPIELKNISSIYNLSTINKNFQKIEEAWDEKLDRLVSQQGNQMEQDLDLNGHKILNASFDSNAFDPFFEEYEQVSQGFLSEVTDLKNETKGFRDEAEGFSSDAAASAKIASLSANIKGEFQPGTTNASKGEVWVYEGSFWYALVNTSDTPSKSNSNWLKVSQDGVEVFDTVADMKAATWLQFGQLVETKGYHSAGDGGQARYLIQDYKGVGALSQELSNGNWAAMQSGVLLESITVYIPSDYPQLQSAIDDMQGRISVKQGVTIDLMIESGHVVKNWLGVADNDYSHFAISSVDSVVPVTLTGALNLITCRRGSSPRINALFNMSENGNNGIVLDNAAAYISPNCGVINAGRDGLSLNASSRAVAYDAIFDGARGNGINVQGASVLAASRISAKNCYLSGLLLGSSSNVQARDGDFSGCADGGSAQVAAGIVVDRSSSLDARNANCSNSKWRGAWIDNNSGANLRDVDASGSVDAGFFIVRNSTVSMQDARANNCGTRALTTFGSCTVRADGLEANNCSGDTTIYIGESTVSIAGASVVDSLGSGLIIVGGSTVQMSSMIINNPNQTGVAINESRASGSNVQITNAGARGVFSTSSDLTLRFGSITGSASNALRAEAGSRVTLQGSTLISPSDMDLFIGGGAVVSAHNVTTSGGPINAGDIQGIASLNTINAQGVVFA